MLLLLGRLAEEASRSRLLLGLLTEEARSGRLRLGLLPLLGLTKESPARGRWLLLLGGRLTKEPSSSVR